MEHEDRVWWHRAYLFRVHLFILALSSLLQFIFNQGNWCIGKPHYARVSGRRQELALKLVCSVSVCPSCPVHGLSSHWVDFHNRAAFWDALLHVVIDEISLSLFSACAELMQLRENRYPCVIIYNLGSVSLVNPKI